MTIHTTTTAASARTELQQHAADLRARLSGLQADAAAHQAPEAAPADAAPLSDLGRYAVGLQAHLKSLAE